MTVLHAERALLPEIGWARDVRVSIASNGRIASAKAGQPPEQGDEVLRNAILLPAPANVHSHAFQRAIAGLAEAASPAGKDSFWTWRTLMYKFLNRLDPGHVEAISAMAYMEMLEAGYASVGEFHYLHHEPGGWDYANPGEMSVRIAAAAGRSGIGLTLLPVLYMQGGVDRRPLTDSQLRFGCELDRFEALFERARRAIDGLPRDAAIGVAPHSLRAVYPDALRTVVALQDGPIHIHVAEQAAEVEEFSTWFKVPPMRWLLDNMGIDGRWCTIHATHMEPDETEGLAKSGAVAGLCPITEANLGDGIFDGARYLGAGGRFAIGSDSNIRIALAEELRTLEYSQRYRDRARVVLARPEASAGRTLFCGAIAGGAQALGREAGAIAAGKWADLVALDATALSIEGLKDDTLLDGWIFAGDDRVVRHVWSAGRHVVRDGRHLRRDEIEARFRNVMAHLRQAL